MLCQFVFFFIAHRRLKKKTALVCCIDGLFVGFLCNACKLSCSENVNYSFTTFMVEFHVTELPDYCAV